MTSLWHNSTTTVISADRDSVDTARGEMIKLTLQSLWPTEGRFHEPPFVAAIGDFNPYCAADVLALMSAAIVVTESLTTPAPVEQKVKDLTYGSTHHGAAAEITVS
jgi:hypothetical protein